MKKLFRFPIFDSRFTVSRLRALRCQEGVPYPENQGRFGRVRVPDLPGPDSASRILSYTMGIIGFGACLAFLAALLFLSCGGDDKKTDTDSSSGGSAKARVKVAWEEWAKKSCEISSVCEPDQFAKGFGTVEKCKAIVDEDAARSGGKDYFLSQEDSCYALFVDSYEGCKNTITAQEPKALCQFRDAFFRTKTSPTIFGTYPECGATLEGVERAASECGFSTLPFVGAPSRHGQ